MRISTSPRQSSIRVRSTQNSLRTLDPKSQRNKRFLPYISPKNKKKKHYRYKSHKPQTHVQRYDQRQPFTVLSIHFASSEFSGSPPVQQQTLIQTTINEEQQSKEQVLPYLQSKKSMPPEQLLRDSGYSSDHRLVSQIYMEKVENRKQKYVNKMETLKKQLELCGPDSRHDRIQKSRIQVKILGEEIRRKRERESIRAEQKKGQKMLQQLLLGGA